MLFCPGGTLSSPCHGISHPVRAGWGGGSILPWVPHPVLTMEYPILSWIGGTLEYSPPGTGLPPPRTGIPPSGTEVLPRKGDGTRHWGTQKAHVQSDPVPFYRSQLHFPACEKCLYQMIIGFHNVKGSNSKNI